MRHDFFLLYFRSVLSGYGCGCLDNELDMELDDEEEMDGFTEDRWDQVTIVMLLPAYTLLVHQWASVLRIFVCAWGLHLGFVSK